MLFSHFSDFSDFSDFIGFEEFISDELFDFPEIFFGRAACRTDSLSVFLLVIFSRNSCIACSSNWRAISRSEDLAVMSAFRHLARMFSGRPAMERASVTVVLL